jgi:hypothetical protein
MDTQLYATKWFDSLTEDKRIKNIDVSELDILNKISYIFDKYEHLKFNPQTLQDVVYDEYSNHDNTSMVICTYLNNKYDYIWEYRSNWIKFRELNHAI